MSVLDHLRPKPKPEPEPITEQSGTTGVWDRIVRRTRTVQQLQQRLARVEQEQKSMNTKVEDLEAELKAVNEKQKEADAEVRKRFDDLAARIGTLEEQLRTQTISDGAESALQAVKTSANSLADIVPNPPKA